MAQIDDSTAELTKMCIESELTIREQCDSLRQQVDIARETDIENIHKASNKMTAEIDTYERDCLSSWMAAKESTKHVVEDVSRRTRAFIAEQQAREDELQLHLNEPSERNKELKSAMFDNKPHVSEHWRVISRRVGLHQHPTSIQEVEHGFHRPQTS